MRERTVGAGTPEIHCSAFVCNCAVKWKDEFQLHSILFSKWQNISTSEHLSTQGWGWGLVVESCPSLSCSASCLIPNSWMASAPITLSPLPSPPFRCSILHDHLWDRRPVDLALATSGVHYSPSLLHLQWVCHHWLECP